MMRAEALDSLIQRLPLPLAERVRPLFFKESVAALPQADASPSVPKGPVIYWTHVALRPFDNPALDVAKHAAFELGVPLLVLQEVMHTEPFLNTRHLCFALEAAHELALGYKDRGISFRLALSSLPQDESALETLARDASMVVCDEIPFPWARALHDQLAKACPLVRVDASCVVPLSRSKKAPTRAFVFRDKHKGQREERVDRGWTDARLPVKAWTLEQTLPTTHQLHDPTTWEAATLLSILSESSVDSSVPPVKHTRGGWRSAQQRWANFKEHHLAGYAKKRNDAARPEAVSRMSAYLRYGCASPFQLANEAQSWGRTHRQAKRGADKYLDELLIWRELAWHFCHHCDNPDALDALPKWARETLSAHASDEREGIYDLAQLEDAQTHDVLWNAAQRSLVAAGELHNNVRMTWGKALIHWRPTPQDALDALVSLNHRFALDGRDPASYGGLLWCLGLFDRPHSPEQSVSGTLRTRPTYIHAERLDVSAWAQHHEEQAVGHTTVPPRVAIIGAGISGVTCARLLATHGVSVTLFEKARGVGGRTATRRQADATFDHGAQRFRARSSSFERTCLALEERGVLAAWPQRLSRLTTEDLSRLSVEGVNWVPAPAMNSLAKTLLPAEASLIIGTRIERICRSSGDEDPSWTLEADTGESFGPFSHLISTAPAEQTGALISELSPTLSEAVARASFAPCIALMIEAEAPIVESSDALRIHSDELAWLSNESTKPGRASGNRWVLHATADFSRRHFESEKAACIEELLVALSKHLGRPLPPITNVTYHRWRYSQVEESVGTPSLFDAELGLGACGDWCLGPNVESAYLSGLHLGSTLLASLALKDERHAFPERPLRSGMP